MPNELIPATPNTSVIIPEELVELTANAIALVQAMPPVTSENVGETREILLELAELARSIDKQRTEAKAPYLAAGKLIDAEAKKLLTQVDSCVATVKSRMAGYAMEVERQRLLAAATQARNEAAAFAEAADTGQTPRITTEVVVPPPAPVATRVDYHVKVVDETLIPRKYLRVDTVAILADLRGGTLVPGCELATTRSVVAR